MELNMEELKTRLNSDSKYLQSNDMRVVEVKKGYAKVEMIIDEHFLNVHGFVHGGALYSLADTAAGAAAGTLTGAGSETGAAGVGIWERNSCMFIGTDSSTSTA